MLQKTKSLMGAVSVSALTAATLLALPAAATASATDDSPTNFHVTAPMDAHGFDADVAKANGYKIITDKNGEQHSVPVTQKAKDRAAQRTNTKLTVPDGVVQPQDEVIGDCGLSWLDGSKGANSTLHFETGYVVRDAVSARVWNVYANGALQDRTWNLSGGPTDAEWSATGSGHVLGAGTAFVLPFESFVTLIDGTICLSGGPSFDFP